MKNNKLLTFAFVSLLTASHTALAETSSNGIDFAVGGDAYFALQNWPDVGMPDDTKLGYGFGGSIGVGVQIDEMKFLVGPHIGISEWTADYSHKPNSITDSVYVSMADMGMQVTMEFDDVIISMGSGSSTISSGYKVNGVDYKYAYNDESYPYSTVFLGFKSDIWMLGVGMVNYKGYAKDASRVDFRLGVTF